METDAVLVGRCRSGADPTAFAELVRRHRDPVYRLVLSILGHGFEADAEDVAQEVFVRAHYALNEFRGEAQFGTWLYRVAFNHALNVKARARFHRPHLGEDALASAASADPGPHERLEAARRARALATAIAELPEVYQASLRLHYWMGIGVAEIAVLVGVPVNTVKSYLHRARQLLGATLSPERGPDDSR